MSVQTLISPSGVVVTEVTNISLSDYLAQQNARLVNLQNSLSVSQEQVNSFTASIASVQAVIGDIENAINSGATITINS